MRDEEKTTSPLMEELMGLRKEVMALKTILGKQGVDNDVSGTSFPQAHPSTSDKSEIVWNVEDAYLARLDESGQHEQSPEVLNHKGSENLEYDAESVKPRPFTESGSFDLSWITQASFGKLLQAIPMPIFLVDVSGKVKFLNTAMTIMLRDPSKIVGSSFATLFCSPEEAKQAQQVLDCVLAARRAQVSEAILTFEDTQVWGRLSFRPVRFGSERSVLVLIEDLTTEKRELALNEKYKHLVEIFPVGIAEFSPSSPRDYPSSSHDRILMILGAELINGNMEFAGLNGYRNVDELKGLRFSKILPTEEEDLEVYRNWIKNNFSPFVYPTKAKAADGELRYFENTLVGNCRDGILVQFWAIKRDITDQKRIHEELMNKLRTIDELYEHIVQSKQAKAIAEHTAAVAHELRQPLAIIGGFARRTASTLSMDKMDVGALLDWSRIVIREVERLEKILGGLIDFGKHESIRLRPANPNEIIEDVIHINGERLKEKNLRAESNLSREVGEIQLDPEGFQRVVRNLVSNAIEASPFGQVIVIETGVAIPSEKAHRTGALDSEAFFELKVKNFGNVIPQDAIARIFDPFFTGKRYGTGLGLTLSRSIVEEHKGSISVKSERDQSTVFTVWLPLK